MCLIPSGLGCCNKTSPSGWLIHNRRSFHKAAGWKSGVRVLAWSNECALLACRILAVFSHGGRGKRSLWAPLHKGTNPIDEDSTLMT